MTLQQASYPVAPSISERPHSLLDVATVREGMAWLDGSDLFNSVNCFRFGATGGICGASDLDIDTLVGQQWVDGFAFSGYGGMTCRLVGTDEAEIRAQVESVYRSGESAAVEAGFLATRFVVGEVPSGETDPLWPAPEAVTTAAVDPMVAVALLEAYAAQHYVGVPTLHLPFSVASLLAQRNALEVAGGQLRTRLGSKVAAGAGYEDSAGPDGVAAPAGTKWAYATGEVLVLRGELAVTPVFD